MRDEFRDMRRRAACRRCGMTPVVAPRGLCVSCEVDLDNAERLLVMPVTLEKGSPVPFVEPRMKLFAPRTTSGLFVVAETMVMYNIDRAVLMFWGGWHLLFTEHIVGDRWTLADNWTGQRTTIGEAYDGRGADEVGV